MRLAYLGGPLLVTAYGLTRLLDGIDGSKGPGPAWIIGHLFFLGALALLAVAMVGLRRERPNRLTTAAMVGGIVGAVAMARVVVVDILVAWGATDRAEMDRNYAKYEFAGSDVLDEAGGILFPLGLVVLLVVLAAGRRQAADGRPAPTGRPADGRRRPAGRRLPWWSPVVALAGFATILATLDLLPVAGLLLLAALAPMATGTDRSPVAAPPR